MENYLELSKSAKALKNRVQLDLGHFVEEREMLLSAHRELEDTLEDHLCLAAVHYYRGDYQEATEPYKQLATEYPDYTCIHVY